MPRASPGLIWKEERLLHLQLFDSNTQNRWEVLEDVSLFPSVTSGQFPNPKGVCEAENLVIPRGEMLEQGRTY